MADLIAASDGALTAALWATIGTAGTGGSSTDLISTSAAATALTTGNLDSTAFTPGAITVDGVALKLGARAVGSPTNTLTATLRNSTTATNIASVVVNVSDLPACSLTDLEGGWHFFKFSASALLVAGETYVIRLTVSATTTAVSFHTDGTANNWQRMLRTTTVQAPAAADDLHVMGVFDGATNPATTGTRSITMDQTAATDYGSASTSANVPSFSVSLRGTVTWGVVAATPYQLRQSGHVVLFSGSTWNMGTVGVEVPRDSSHLLAFDCAADNDFGLIARNGSTLAINGLSRTIAKAVTKTLLAADEAALATVIDVVDDTGWLSGDEVGIASTTRTAAQFERRILTGAAGAASFTITVGLTNAHAGTGDVVAEVILLTRNVRIESVSTTAVSFVNIKATATAAIRWASFRYVGSSTAGKRGLEIETTAGGACTVEDCVIQDTDSAGLYFAGTAHDGWVVRRTTLFNAARAAFTSAVTIAVTSGVAYILDDALVMGTTASSTCGFDLLDVGGIIGPLSASSAVDSGIKINESGSGGTAWVGPWISHSNTLSGLLINGVVLYETTVPETRLWRNGANGVHNVGALISCVFNGGLWLGNATANYRSNGGTAARGAYRVTLDTVTLAGDTTFASSDGFLIDAGTMSIDAQWYFRNCTFSPTSGIRVPHTTDVRVAAASTPTRFLEIFAANTTFGAAAEVTFDTGAARGSVVASAMHDQTESVHKVFQPHGTLAYEATTAPSVPERPSLRLTVIAATTAVPLRTNADQSGFGFLIPIRDGQTATVSVKVQKDATYNGTQPRLRVLENQQVGITADTTLATMAGAAGAFETLSGTTIAVSADGVLECVVEVDGTAGFVVIDTWGVA